MILTVLDYSVSGVFVYKDVAVGDNASYERLIQKKGHKLTDVYWMVSNKVSVVLPKKLDVNISQTYV